MRWEILAGLFILMIGMAQAMVIDNAVLSTLQTDNEARIIVAYDGHGPINPKLKQVPETNILVGTLSKKDIADLSNDPAVEGIYLDWKLSITRDDGWDIINADILNSYSINGTNLTGSGYTLCILDTGVDYKHPQLSGCNSTEFTSGTCSMYPYGYDYVNSDNDPWDDEGHGTHVAGIASKVVPDAKIIPMKVCDSAGDCYVSDMMTAVSWCNAFRAVYNITVISMSIGDKAAWTDDDCFPSDPLIQQINNAMDNGIFVTAASGNEGFTTGLNYPACARGAASIGATTKSDTMASFTNTYTTLDLLAPGYQINSTYPGDTFVSMSGTSMATPFAAGSGILMQQYHKLLDNVTLSSDQVQYKLKTGGVIVESWPRIDLDASLAAGYQCYISDDCTADSWHGEAECINDSLYQNYSDYSCDYGTCMQNISYLLKETCTNGCQDGSCIQVAESPSGSGGSSSFNIDHITLESNTELAIQQPATIQASIYDRFDRLYDAEDVVLSLVNNQTKERTMLGHMQRTSQGQYMLDITPEIAPGDYILEVRASESYNTITAQKAVKLVKLSRILTLQSIGFQDADAPGILASLMNWLKQMAWGQGWP